MKTPPATNLCLAFVLPEISDPVLPPSDFALVTWLPLLESTAANH